jgi:hypothetical protein
LDTVVASNDNSSKAAVTLTQENGRMTVNKDLERTLKQVVVDL